MLTLGAREKEKEKEGNSFLADVWREAFIAFAQRKDMSAHDCADFADMSLTLFKERFHW